MNHAFQHALYTSRFLGRRRLLPFGGLGCVGLNLRGLLHGGDTRAAPPPASQPIRPCIFLYYYGAPSHIDTWDMTPDAPREVRGEFKPIATCVPGIQVSEHLPRCSKLMDRLAVIRSMHHGMRNHNAAAVESLC